MASRLLLTLCLFWGGTLSAQRMVVLGDSLSDGGFYLGIRQIENGGLLWHEYLADRLGYDRAVTGFLGASGLNLAVSAIRVDEL